MSNYEIKYLKYKTKYNMLLEGGMLSMFSQPKLPDHFKGCNDKDVINKIKNDQSLLSIINLQGKSGQFVSIYYIGNSDINQKFIDYFKMVDEEKKKLEKKHSDELTYFRNSRTNITAAELNTATQNADRRYREALTGFYDSNPHVSFMTMDNQEINFVKCDNIIYNKDKIIIIQTTDGKII